MTARAFTVRPAQLGDWEQIYPLYGDVPGHDSLAAARERFGRKLASELECVLVAVQGQRVIGVALAHQWEEYLMTGERQIRFSTLKVLPEERRRGVGKALLEGIIAWAKSRDARWLEWYASPSAVPFYSRLGYQGILDPTPDNPYYEIDFKAGS